MVVERRVYARSSPTWLGRAGPADLSREGQATPPPPRERQHDPRETEAELVGSEKGAAEVEGSDEEPTAGCAARSKALPRPAMAPGCRMPARAYGYLVRPTIANRRRLASLDA